MLKNEFYKLFRSKAFWVTLGLAVGLDILFAVITWVSVTHVPPELEMFKPTIDAAHGLTDAASNSQIITIMAIAIISSFIMADYQNGIVRNMVMAGKPRWQIYFTKLLLCTIVTLILFTIYWAISTIAFAFLGGAGSVNFGAYIGTLALTLLLMISVASVIMFIGDLTRHVGATVGIILGVMIVCQLVGVAGLRLDNEILSNVFKFIGEIFVCNSLVYMDFDLGVWKIVQYVITAIVTFAVASGLGYWLFKKRDLK